MKIVKNLALWFVFIFMLSGMFLYFPSIASAAMALTCVLTLPIEKWQLFLNKVLKKKAKIVLAIVLAIISFCIAPVEEVPNDTANQSSLSSHETDPPPSSDKYDPVKTESITTSGPKETDITEPTTPPEIDNTPTTEPITVPEIEKTAIPDSITIHDPKETQKNEHPPETKELYEYDALQTIFLAIAPDITIEEVETLIADYGICYTRKEYNKSGGGKSITFKVAYTAGAAKQSHPEAGDYLEISFDKESGTLMTAQYVKSGSIRSALLYCHGNWYDFSDSNAEDYSGYYLIDGLSKEDGITIKYSNGREATTHYFLYHSAEELIYHIINIS